MKKYFENLSSNTLSANGNQTYITDNIPKNEGTGLVFIKVFRGGTFDYRFVYSGIIDSTFNDGTISKCNDLCDWSINSLSVAVTDRCEPSEPEFTEILFNGQQGAYIGNQKYVVSDKIKITAAKDSYLCLKIVFSGKTIPCHKESMIPVFRLIDGSFVLCPEAPVPVLTAIEFQSEAKLCFAGDSITQGIGATFNSYNNFAARAGEAIGDRYSYWNLGLGYGRASDAASDGIWLEKMKSNDYAVVCYGVNDIQRGHSAEEIKDDLTKILDELQKAGVKVLLQTIPPFDYDEKKAEIWNDVNTYLRNELSHKADGFFDNVPILGKNGKTDPRAKYGGHPDDEGCEAWAKELVPHIIRLLK